MEVTDCKKLVESKQEEWSPLIARWKTDHALVFDPYVMRNYDNNPTKEVDNVTTDEAANLRNRVVAALTSAREQTVVESNTVRDKDIVHIEEFLRDINCEADELRQKRGGSPLRVFHAEQVCQNGRCAERITLHKKDNQLVVDILPLDTRNFFFEFGTEGLKWCCYITFRTPKAIEDEYATTVHGTDALEVHDFWTPEQNLVYIASPETTLKTQKNIYKQNGKKYIPFVVSICPVGTSMMDKAHIEHWGESILWLGRRMFPEWDKMATIEQTMNRLSVKPPYQMPLDQPKQADLSDMQIRPGEIVPVEKNGDITVIPTPDIRNAMRDSREYFNALRQRAGLPDLSYGTAGYPESNVRTVTLIGQTDPIYRPRFAALAALQVQRARMLISQFMGIGGSAFLGAEGYMTKYSSRELKGDYSIEYRFHAKSPERELANYTLAGAASQWLPTKKILADIIEVDDPEGIMAEQRAEQAERMDSAIMLHRYGHSLIDQGDDQSLMEAEMVCDLECQMIAKRRQQPELEVNEPESKVKGAMATAGLLGKPTIGTAQG